MSLCISIYCLDIIDQDLSIFAGGNSWRFSGNTFDTVSVVVVLLVVDV